MTWTRSTLAEYMGDCVLYRRLEPTCEGQRGLGDLWAEAGLERYYIPRKTTPEYARVLLLLLAEAQRARGVQRPIERALFIGDTILNDGTAARFLGDHLPMRAFIGADRAHVPAAATWQGGLFVANRWATLGDWYAEVRAAGFGGDEATAVLVDLDKTAIGARGRNDGAIDAARVRAMLRTLRGALGEGLGEAAFRAVYDPLNQPARHCFTADNQDYLAYITLMVTGGVFSAQDLWAELDAGTLATVEEFAARCDARRGAMGEGLRQAHDEVCGGIAAQDPTPFKAFRRREYLETVAAMDALPDEAPVEEVLAGEIVLTEEVASLCRHLAARGALVMGLSDKPDEASLPTPAHVARGCRPLHRTRMKVYGDAVI